MQNLDWNDLRYVLSTARTGRLAEAARRMKVDATTVSRRLARIERALGAQIFHRDTGLLVPTEVGARVLEHAERVELAIDELGSAAMGADARASGTVRITSTPWLINRLLIPALAALHVDHPFITIDLNSEPRNVDVTKREADIAVRLARPHREHRALARRLATFGFAVYGPAGRKPSSLPWITFEEGMATLPQAVWITRAMKREGKRQPILLANDAEVMLHAIVNGLGKSILPCAIGDRTTGLARLSGRTPVVHREVWLMVHPELRHLSRIRTVISWIEQTILAHAG
jgi:DNA-binding transcriptional LysR family regulator